MFFRYLNTATPKLITADLTAVGVNVTAAWTWLDEVNSLLQVVLTVVGIIAAIAAARYHIRKTRELGKDQDAD